MKIPFERKKIGALIAIGGEHIVRRYGARQVIKFPFGPRYFLDQHKHCENVARDEEVARKYFSQYLIDRQVFFYPSRSGRPTYAIIEPFITGRHMKRSDLDNSEIRRQFEEIVAINRDMYTQEELLFDMFGIWGLLWRGKREVANIMIEEGSDRLVVVDPSVMHFGTHKDQQILVSSVTHWALFRQRRLLKYYLGD